MVSWTFIFLCQIFCFLSVFLRCVGFLLFIQIMHCTFFCFLFCVLCILCFVFCVFYCMLCFVYTVFCVLCTRPWSCAGSKTGCPRFLDWGSFYISPQRTRPTTTKSGSPTHLILLQISWGAWLAISCILITRIKCLQGRSLSLLIGSRLDIIALICFMCWKWNVCWTFFTDHYFLQKCTKSHLGRPAELKADDFLREKNWPHLRFVPE